jgi:hypothetical protein
MKRSGLGCAFAIVVCVAACGGDAGSGSKSNDSKEAAGSGASADSTKGGAPCGATSCTAPKGSTAEPCCMDRFAGTCGVMVGNVCGIGPKVDARCPVPDLKLMIPNGIMEPVGCCTGDNECGVDFGAGCQSRTVLCMGIGLDQVDKLKVETCDGEALPRPADCGTMMVTLPSLPAQSGK